MLLGDPSNPASPSFSAPAPATHRSYIPSLIPPGVDPAKVDSKMFYTYVPNTIKTRKRTTPAQLEILEGVFITDKKPNAPRRKELAKKLKMSPREVQVWFQNRRAKEKKSFAKKDPSPTSPTASTSLASSTAPITTDVSPSPEAAADVLADPVPPQSSASPVTKIEPQTPEPSPRPSQSASWQSPPVPSPPSNDSFDQLQQHHATPTRSPPEPSPAVYGLRRSSLPVLSLVPPQEPPPQSLPSSNLSPHMQQEPSPHQHNYNLPPSFPSAVLSPHMLQHRRSTGALPGHPYALPVRRPSAAQADYPPPSGPPPGLSPPHAAPYMRASISEGMDMPGLPTSRFANSGGHGSQSHHSARFHPFQSQSRRPNLAHRASVPALFHVPHNAHSQHLSAPPMPMSTFPPTPTSAIPLEEQQQDEVLWSNPDPFGTGAGAVALAPDAGYSFGMPPAVSATSGVPTSGYEFPERKPSVAPSDPDTEYTFTMESGVYRRSAGSVVSLYGAGSDTGTTTSTGSSAGPYFSDVTSEGQGIDEDGRRGSCVSTSEMLSRLHVGGAQQVKATRAPLERGATGMRLNTGLSLIPPQRPTASAST
ncbi:hypothetical protein BJV77DRAFT_372116 [Russula vinacea]|nr:hypothetical protein BJV77DRAFT_372116 [Russula vinacea]